MNKKGMTLVEIIVSLGLIAIVLTFLLNLFISVRGTYNTSKIQADYDIITATLIKTIGDDIENYGLRTVERISTAKNGSAVILTFDAYRPSKLSERIRKVLKVYQDTRGHYFISYAYDSKYTQNITSKERITNVARELPEDVIIDTRENIKINKLGNKAVEIKIPISNSRGTNYSINVYGLIVT